MDKNLLKKENLVSELGNAIESDTLKNTLGEKAKYLDDLKHLTEYPQRFQDTKKRVFRLALVCVALTLMLIVLEWLLLPFGFGLKILLTIITIIGAVYGAVYVGKKIFENVKDTIVSSYNKIQNNYEQRILS